MVRKIIYSTATILVAASLIWAANDPWKSKPYDQWDDKDIQTIFNDSPWAKVVQIANSLPSDSGMPPEPSSASSGQQSRGMGEAQDNLLKLPGATKPRQHLQPRQPPLWFAGFPPERFAKLPSATQSSRAS